MQTLFSLWSECQAAQQRLLDTFTESRMPTKEHTFKSAWDSFKQREHARGVYQAALRLMRWVRAERTMPMRRTYVVTGAASGIGAAMARYCRRRGGRVIACDLHDADVVADLTTAEGRAALVDEVARLSEGRIDAIVANAGGGPPETSLSLNFFGAVATLEGLRPLLKASPAPRAVAVSSVAALHSPVSGLVEACLNMDEAAAVAAARSATAAARRNPADPNALPGNEQAALNLYGTAKCALQLWCRRAAAKPEWAGAGIPLNVIALGFFDTPAAAPVLSNPNRRAAMGRLAPLRGAYPGRPEEAAAALFWCVSAGNSQMTGQILYIDGGIECLARGERPH